MPVGHCTRCDAELGVGRFCTNCGQPVGERPAVTAAVEPAATGALPTPARFPLFADDVDSGDETAVAASVGSSPRAAWLPWALGLVVMALVAGLGAFLLLSGGGPSATASDPAATEREPRERRTDRSADPTPEQTTEPETAPAGPADLARYAGVEAPQPAPPSQDNSGNVVRYDAAQMVDGVPETTWRTPGDATGATITLTFEEPTVLSEVGLINGYAKVGQDAQGPLDWYHGNRRVLAVEWTFDDGTVTTQELDDTTVVQSVSVPQVETTTVQLRLLEVSSPGPGRASRDYTAISDVRLFGHTA